MKKFSLLLGTLGGAMAGYLLSNKKLRDDLVNAKDPEAAAKLLGSHLQRDGKNLAKQVREFVESDDVQTNLKRAKAFAKDKASEAKVELDKMMTKGKKQATKAARKGAKAARHKVTSMRQLS
jgi:ribosomal protein L17